MTHPCPNCGYCPSCGRTNVRPFWPHGWRWPYWTNPYGTIWYGYGTSQVNPNATFNITQTGATTGQ